MSAEFRHIFFNDGELLRIVSHHCRQQAHRLPAGSVVDLKILSDPVPELECQIAPDDSGPRVKVSLRGEDLKAAVIAHCLKSRIPLPQRGATKRLEVLGDRLALVVTINVASERMTEFKF